MTVMCYSPPCITARRGRLRHQENAAKPPQPDAGGVVFLLFSFGKPPRPRDQRRLRGILLIARPPLLAVMQGGEHARFQFVHTCIDRRYSYGIDLQRLPLRASSNAMPWLSSKFPTASSCATTALA